MNLTQERHHLTLDWPADEALLPGLGPLDGLQSLTLTLAGPTAERVDFSERFPPFRYLTVITDGAHLPEGLTTLGPVEWLRLVGRKLRGLPGDFAQFTTLGNLSLIDTRTLDLVSVLPVLTQLPCLEGLEISGAKDKTAPSALAELGSVRRLQLADGLLKRWGESPTYALLARMPVLRTLTVAFSDNKHQPDFPEAILALDGLERIEFDGWWSFQNLPLHLGRFRETVLSLRGFSGRNANLLRTDPFFERYRDQPLTPAQRERLFGFWLGYDVRMREHLPNPLLDAFRAGEPLPVFFHDPAPKGSIRQRADGLRRLGFQAAPAPHGPGVVPIIGPRTPWETVERLVLDDQPFALEDHFGAALLAADDPYLLQPEYEALNDDLLRLLASNHLENLLLAFQIIETGGANRLVRSLLAAIYLAHPDKAVQRGAKKIYQRFLPPSYQSHAAKRPTLRLTGQWKDLHRDYARHAEIDWFAFVLMAHRIAGENPNVRDVEAHRIDLKGLDVGEIPPYLRFFTNLREIVLDQNPGLDLVAALPHLAALPSLRVLSLEHCHGTVPAGALAGLAHLTELRLAYNSLENPADLGDLPGLTHLGLAGCRLTDWAWLGRLPVLEHLDLSANDLAALPEPVWSLFSLRTLTARKNRLTAVDLRVRTLPHLTELDLADNAIPRLDAFLLGMPALRVLSLRGNRIQTFDPEDYRRAFGEKPIALTSLDLGRNQLADLHFRRLVFPDLHTLDVSGNALTRLDDTLFTNTRVATFWADQNRIERLPEVAGRRSFIRFSAEKNRIRELPEALAHWTVEHLNLRHNEIERIAEAFFPGTDQWGQRRYWKIDPNPVCRQPGFSEFEFKMGKRRGDSG